MADSRVAWRVSTLLGTVAVLLACVMTVSTTPASAAGESYNLIVAINGSTFFFEQLRRVYILEGPLRQDFQAATAGIADIANVQVQLNNTAMYVTYVATPHDGHTVDEVSKSIYASKFVSLNLVLDAARSLMSNDPSKKRYVELLPVNVHPFTPLLPSTGTTPAPVYVETVQSSHTVYLSGEYSKWNVLVQSSPGPVKNILMSTVVTTLSHGNMTVTCVVDSLAARPADSTRTQPGDIRSGLTAHVTVTQRLTKETRHSYKALEVGAALQNMDTFWINTVYPNVDLTNLTVVVLAVTSPYKLVSDKPTASARGGLIAMAVIFLLIMVAVALVVGVLVFLEPKVGRQVDKQQSTLQRYVPPCSNRFLPAPDSRAGLGVAGHSSRSAFRDDDDEDSDNDNYDTTRSSTAMCGRADDEYKTTGASPPDNEAQTPSSTTQRERRQQQQQQQPLFDDDDIDYTDYDAAVADALSGTTFVADERRLVLSRPTSSSMRDGLATSPSFSRSQTSHGEGRFRVPVVHTSSPTDSAEYLPPSAHGDWRPNPFQPRLSARKQWL